MLPKLLTQIFGSRNDRLLKQYRHVVQQINALEPQFEQLDDVALKAKTEEFRGRVAAGETLDALLPEAFAVCREGSKRALKMRHFDVQLIGGMVMHDGKIAEMRTGEGKTLMATLPVYLNALTGKGVHLVTVNDYLAKRDAEWMGRLYTFLGLSVGVNLSQMSREEKQAAYRADVTYGTNNEFGFDYLRDNMVTELEQRVQRDKSFAIVDEVVAAFLVALGPSLQPGHEPREREVQVARFLGLAADDERRARLVDEDVVHLVHDREAAFALDSLVELEDHVVAQVVEPEFVVRAIGDVRCVGLAPADRTQA